MPKLYRILLDQKAYNALKAESMVRHKSLKDTMSFMIQENLSQEAREILKILRDTDKPSSFIEMPEPIEKATVKDQQKKLLHDNAQAQSDIIKLYREGKTVRQIGKQVGYADSTVRSFIKRKVKAGVLLLETVNSS